MTHTAKDSLGVTQSFKSGTASGELVPHVNVDALSTAQLGSVGDSTVSPGSQGTLLALTRSLLSQVASGVALQASTAQIGNVALQPRAAVGAGVYTHLSLATQNRTQVKTSSGTVYGWSISNASAAAYVKLYDSVSATASGTSALVPKLTIRVPASGDRDYSNPMGIVFSSGIAFGMVSGAGAAASGAVGASDIVLNLFYV